MRRSVTDPGFYNRTYPHCRKAESLERVSSDPGVLATAVVSFWEIPLFNPHHGKSLHR